MIIKIIFFIKLFLLFFFNYNNKSLNGLCGCIFFISRDHLPVRPMPSTIVLAVCVAAGSTATVRTILCCLLTAVCTLLSGNCSGVIVNTSSCRVIITSSRGGGGVVVHSTSGSPVPLAGVAAVGLAARPTTSICAGAGGWLVTVNTFCWPHCWYSRRRGCFSDSC